MTAKAALVVVIVNALMSAALLAAYAAWIAPSILGVRPKSPPTASSAILTRGELKSYCFPPSPPSGCEPFFLVFGGRTSTPL